MDNPAVDAVLTAAVLFSTAYRMRDEAAAEDAARRLTNAVAEWERSIEPGPPVIVGFATAGAADLRV